MWNASLAEYVYVRVYSKYADFSFVARFKKTQNLPIFPPKEAVRHGQYSTRQKEEEKEKGRRRRRRESFLKSLKIYLTRMR